MQVMCRQNVLIVILSITWHYVWQSHKIRIHTSSGQRPFLSILKRINVDYQSFIFKLSSHLYSIQCEKLKSFKLISFLRAILFDECIHQRHHDDHKRQAFSVVIRISQLVGYVTTTRFIYRQFQINIFICYHRTIYNVLMKKRELCELQCNSIAVNFSGRNYW